MAGRRLSSNDVSVVIALAIVVLVLLLVYVAERGAGSARKPIAVTAADARARAPGCVPARFREPPAAMPLAARRRQLRRSRRRAGAPESDGRSRWPMRQRDEAVAGDPAPRSNARAEPRARAAALYFRAARDRIDAAVAERARTARDDCLDDQARRDGDSDSAEALARLAVDVRRSAGLCLGLSLCVERAARERPELPAGQRGCSGHGSIPSNAEPWFAVARAKRGAARTRPGSTTRCSTSPPRRSTIPVGAGVAAQMISGRAARTSDAVGTWLAALTRVSLRSGSTSSVAGRDQVLRARAPSATRTGARPATRSRRCSSIDRRRCSVA